MIEAIFTLSLKSTIPKEDVNFSLQLMDDDKCLADYGLSSTQAKAQSPAEVGLALMVDGSFEDLEKTPYSNPPELPDVMKPGQESTAQETATA